MNKLQTLINERIQDEIDSLYYGDDSASVYVDTGDVPIEDLEKLTIDELEDILSLAGAEYSTTQEYYSYDGNEEYEKTVNYEVLSIEIETFESFTDFELVIELERIE